MIQALETVVSAHEPPEQGLVHGDVGVAVHLYAGSAAYEAEFVTGEGATVAVVTLEKESIRPVKRREILHVCDMAA